MIVLKVLLYSLLFLVGLVAAAYAVVVLIGPILAMAAILAVLWVVAKAYQLLFCPRQDHAQGP